MKQSKHGNNPHYKNKYGLTRYIPEAIARIVRTECGFGCVVCGGSIVEYEHIDPPFADAKRHDPSRIALLCPTCHGKVTRRYMSKQTVKEKRAKPYCKQSGFSWGDFDISSSGSFFLGSAQFLNCAIQMTTNGETILNIARGEPGQPIQISGIFTDSIGRPLLRIKNNIWSASSGVWDVEFTAGTIRFRESQSSTTMLIRAVPPDAVKIEHLKMMYHQAEINVDNDLCKIYKNGECLFVIAHTIFQNIDFSF